MNSAHILRRMNGWLTIAWILSIPIAIYFKDSIEFLVFISVYAIITGHLSSWQSARVESNQADDANVREVLDVVKRLEKKINVKEDSLHM